MKSKEIKHVVSGINDATSYVSSCHTSVPFCDFDECMVLCPCLLDFCLLCLTWQGMNFDVDSPEDHPEKLLYHQFWTPLTHASYHPFLIATSVTLVLFGLGTGLSTMACCLTDHHHQCCPVNWPSGTHQ